VGKFEFLIFVTILATGSLNPWVLWLSEDLLSPSSPSSIRFPDKEPITYSATLMHPCQLGSEMDLHPVFLAMVSLPGVHAGIHVVYNCSAPMLMLTNVKDLKLENHV
jgi:hypothetical protein